jgi:WD40 repeat protein
MRLDLLLMLPTMNSFLVLDLITMSFLSLSLSPFLLHSHQVYAWDPTTKTLQMKLIGHRHSVVGVSVVYNPLERAVTVDEAGTVKIWNIDRSQGFRGQHLQSLSAQAQSQINVISFTPILSHGLFLVSLSLSLSLCLSHTHPLSQVGH